MSYTNNEHRQNEAEGNAALPAHVNDFIKMSEELESAVKRNDAIAITQARSHLKIFYGTLAEEQQKDIQVFINRELAGIHIETQRSHTVRALHNVLQVPGIVMHALAQTVPQFTGKTLELIVTTLGLSIRGVVKGVQTTVREFKKA